jgi:hypothetical protein
VVFTGKPEGPNEVFDGGGDIAKNVFQLHWVDASAGEIVNRQ